MKRRRLKSYDLKQDMYLCNLNNKYNSILVPGSTNAGIKNYPCRVYGILGLNCPVLKKEIYV